MTQADEKSHFQYELDGGAHVTPDEGRCAMEWVSFLAGEPHSDSPECVAPVLRMFCVRLNDSLAYGPRQKLRPYLARTIGTRDDGLDPVRVRMCVDWLVRTYTPAWLDVVGSTESADALRQDRITTGREVGRVVNIMRAEDAGQRLQHSVTSRMIVRCEEMLAEVWGPAYPVAAAAELFVGAGDRERGVLVSTVRSLLRDVAITLGLLAYEPLGVDWGLINRTNAELQASLFDLLDRMLPTEVIQLPVVPEWREVCGVAR